MSNMKNIVDSVTEKNERFYIEVESEHFGAMFRILADSEHVRGFGTIPAKVTNPFHRKEPFDIVLFDIILRTDAERKIAHEEEKGL